MSVKRSPIDRVSRAIVLGLVALIGGAFLLGLLYGLIIVPLQR